MADKRLVGTAKVSKVLGVSVTTVKRWVDEGVLPAYKTPGGHRKLLVADVLRIIREQNFPHLDLGQLKIATPREGSPVAAILHLQLYNALRRGDSSAARSVIHGAYGNGLKIEALADSVISPAMKRLGQDWEKGRIDVLHEHHATQICVGVLYELKSQLEYNAKSQPPTAVGGGPEGDPYLLANILAQMVLLDGGWRVVNLGPNTPFASFQKTLQEFRPRLVWLSVSYLENAQSFVREYQEFYQTAAKDGIAVAVGGRALSETIRSSMLYTTYGDGLTHLASFARSLNPPLRRRKRGRPPGS